jgi:hypothetical protein
MHFVFSSFFSFLADTRRQELSQYRALLLRLAGWGEYKCLTGALRDVLTPIVTILAGLMRRDDCAAARGSAGAN